MSPASQGPVHVIRCRDAIPGVWSGGYVLRVVMTADASFAFGRFRGGEELRLLAGEYAYVGSAVGAGGAPLAARLIRHATRTGPRPAHAIRDRINAALGGCQREDAARPKREGGKKLHWHVDYLLDRPEAEIAGVVALVSARRVELELCRLLEEDPALRPVAPGLGASDHAGGTHLFVAAASWWQQFVGRVKAELSAEP